MKRLSQIGIASGVLLAGFAAGRWVAGHGRESDVIASRVLEEPAKRSHSRSPELDGLLCEISTGKLSAARARIAVLVADPSGNQEELLKLMVAIAKKDGASFDIIAADLPGGWRMQLMIHCFLELSKDPAELFRALGDSEAIRAQAFDKSWSGVLRKVILDAPDLFLDRLERGEFAWSSETYKEMTAPLWTDGASAARIVELCKSGRIPIDDEVTLARFMIHLDAEDLKRLGSGAGSPQVMASIAQEMKARELFADFHPTNDSWNEIGKERMFYGVSELMKDSGVPALDWNEVPQDTRASLASFMLGAAKPGDMQSLLDSISGSNLGTAEKSAIIAESAETLFHADGEIGMAVKFAQAIPTSPDGSNPGQDLIVKWVSYDPANAQAYADKIPPSPFRDRIVARIQEIRP